jgi:hypothetical protein
MMAVSLRLWLEGRLPGLNEVTAKNRGSAGWVSGAQQKKRVERGLAWQLRDVGRIEGCYHWRFVWRVKNRRRDPDNIASAVKFIFDALQHAGVIENDGWGQIATISHAFEIGEPEGVWVNALQDDPTLAIAEFERRGDDKIGY